MERMNFDLINNVLPNALELHKRFMGDLTIKNISEKSKLSEDMTLKTISGIYLEKIKYFENKEFSLIGISFLFFLNKYGNIKNLAEKKFYQVI